jgi:hypothetical protein
VAGFAFGFLAGVLAFFREGKWEESGSVQGFGALAYQSPEYACDADARSGENQIGIGRVAGAQQHFFRLPGS